MSEPSDSIKAKAERLLVSGRVVVTCAEDSLSARVEGDHGTYVLSRHGTRWLCPCPARGKCSHIVSVELVTA